MSACCSGRLAFGGTDITTIALGGFPARARTDRNAFLFFTALVWLGILSGFGTDAFDHIKKYGLDYPPIVHVHAAAFLGWLVLFTVQAALIRNARPDLHRRLGMAGAGLAAVMVVLGPATALHVDNARFLATGRTPEFLAVQLGDILAFAGLTGAGLLLRSRAAAHKRLMLLGLIYISDAGFARFINQFAAAPLGGTIWGETVGLYLATDLLVLAFGVYDLVRRGTLHPAYVAGAIWMFALQATAVTLMHTARWKVLSLHLIGH
jgi:hypothetical protein